MRCPDPPLGTRTTLLIASILLAGSTPASAGELYRNSKLGFSFAVPEGAVRCADSSTGPEHGAAMWLDGQTGECGKHPDRPRIAVNGAYNTMFWASPKAALQELCTHGDVVKPPRIEVGGYSAAVCKVVRVDGWIEVELAIMTGVRPPPYHDPEDSYPLMFYTIHLNTTPEREREDLQRMRAVAKSLRIFEPK